MLMLKKIKLIAVLIFFVLQLAAQKPERIALTNVTIVDVEKGQLIKNQTVIIEKDRIAEIIPFTPKIKLINCKIINAQGSFLMPGLIDTHQHLYGYIMNNKWEDLKLIFKLMLANGVTGIREAGASVYTQQTISVRDSLNKQYYPGPKMYVSGITTTSNLKHFHISNYSDLVDTFSKIGVDGIKIKFTTFRETKEIIDAAKRQHLPVYGHTSNLWRNETSNIQGDFTMDAVEYGISGVMHVLGYAPVGQNQLPQGPEPVYSSESKLWEKWWLYFDALWLHADPLAEQELINEMIRKKVWLEPTLSVESVSSTYDEILRKKALQYFFYPDSSLIQGFPLPGGSELDSARLAFRRKQLFVKKFYEAGGLLLAGTDGRLYGSDLKDELRYFVGAGIPLAAVLKIVTYNNALALGWINDLGSVTKGKLANLILLKSDPLQDINNLEKIEAILLNGNYYSKKDLDKWLTEVRVYAVKQKAKK